MMNQPNKKEFDCMALKKEAQDLIYDEIKNMTPEQEIEYFRNAVQMSRFCEWWERAESSTGNRVNRAS